MNKLTFLLLLAFMGFLSSCTSEYEERLKQGLELKEKLAIMERSNNLLFNDRLTDEIMEIRGEINMLAKVSGNEELFLEQVYND